MGQILTANEKQERVLVAKSKDPRPTYYYLFVTAYIDGLIPERLQSVVTKDTALAVLIEVAPQAMEENMTLLNAEDMSKALADSGKVALYGINFDTDKDTLRADSEPTLKQIAKLLADNQGCVFASSAIPTIKASPSITSTSVDAAPPRWFAS